MKKTTIIASLIATLSAFSIAFAAAAFVPPLDKVSFQLSAEQWATATTANVVVSVNAVLNDTQLTEIHSHIMNSLQKIAGNVDWHITKFSRSKNQAGLEQLYAEAEARIPENSLNSLRKNAASVSTPGVTYAITAINFSPSSDEIEKIKTNLRQEIYTEAQAELQRINKIYPNENFHVHKIDFNIAPTPAPQILMAVSSAAPRSTPMPVSRKIELTANIVLASNFEM